MEKTIIKTVLGSKMELRFSLKLCKKQGEYKLDHSKLKSDYADIVNLLPSSGGILIIEGVRSNKESKLVEVLNSNFDLKGEFKSKTVKNGSEDEIITRLMWIMQNFQNKTFKKFIFHRGYKAKLVS